MIKRLKQAWKLSKTPEVNILVMAEEKQKQIDEAMTAIKENQEGDGKAVFFSDDVTPEETLEYERDQAGTLPWYKRIMNLK